MLFKTVFQAFFSILWMLFVIVLINVCGVNKMINNQVLSMSFEIINLSILNDGKN